MNESKTAAAFTVQIITLVFLPIILTVLGVDLLMAVSVEVFVILCFNCARNIGKNIFFFFFLISFFVFLMSGDIAEAIFDKHYYLQFGEDATRHSRICILISLLSVFAGYNLTFDNNTNLTQPDGNMSENSFKYSIRYSAKFVFYCTYIILLINTIDTVIFVLNNGYVAYYTSYSTFLPSIISELADFTPVAFCVFLGTCPSKKECKPIIALYLIYAVLTFMIGTRGTLIYTVLFVLAYMIYRGYREKEVWVSKRVIILLCLLIPYILAFLFLYDYIRTGNEIKFVSVSDSILDFFVNIGASSKVIKYGYEYKGHINGFRWFSMGETLNYFKYGTLFNLFDLSSIPSRHSAEFALQGHAFGDYISYLVMRNGFLSGHGTGSSFIAELFADFGYVGVSVGSFLYGVLFKKISSMNESKWLSTSIKLYIFFSLIKAPRSNFDGFIAAIVNVNFIIIMLFIYFFAQFVHDRSYVKWKNYKKIE